MAEVSIGANCCAGFRCARRLPHLSSRIVFPRVFAWSKTSRFRVVMFPAAGCCLVVVKCDSHGKACAIRAVRHVRTDLCTAAMITQGGSSRMSYESPLSSRISHALSSAQPNRQAVASSADAGPITFCHRAPLPQCKRTQARVNAFCSCGLLNQFCHMASDQYLMGCTCAANAGSMVDPPASTVCSTRSGFLPHASGDAAEAAPHVHQGRV